MYFSDLFDIRYEAVGKLDSRSEITQYWQEEFEKGVLYYLEDNRVKGVLLWNTWGQVDHAKEILAMEGPVYRKNLIGKIT